MIENIERVPCTLVWDILRLPCRRVCVALCLEEEDKMIRRSKSILFLCILTCASWTTRLRISGSELGWDMGFELGLSVGMVLGAPVGFPLVYQIKIFFGLEPGNFFGTWEVYLVGVSLGTLVVLIIGTGEGYLVGLSLGLPLVYPTDLIFLTRCWALLLGCGLDLKQ